ncbi:MAG TPA: carbohydrate kinase family protein, partial [Patescibacteria group bacterium]|nr:carbohydrate kinase family protein [Patescibacteria group bacterium]
MNIIIHGSIAYDRIMNFPGYFKEHILPDKIHSLNVSFQINKLSEMRGGTGGNIAYNMVLLEETPMLLSCVGSDGETYLHSLKELGVRVDAVEK